MTILTISRQKGSFGDEIASMLARRLGYHLYDREIINKAARESGSPEIALADIDELNLLGLSVTEEESCAYRCAISDILHEIARNGDAIFLGRGGQVILQDDPSALHVRIFAPIELRIQRIAQRQEIDLDKARTLVRGADKHSRRHLKRCYQVDWDDPTLYDLVINTHKLLPESACELIHQALNNLTCSGVVV